MEVLLWMCDRASPQSTKPLGPRRRRPCRQCEDQRPISATLQICRCGNPVSNSTSVGYPILRANSFANICRWQRVSASSQWHITVTCPRRASSCRSRNVNFWPWFFMFGFLRSNTGLNFSSALYRRENSGHVRWPILYFLRSRSLGPRFAIHT
jgi:hypothetical protein